jgi:hypothetical protein
MRIEKWRLTRGLIVYYIASLGLLLYEFPFWSNIGYHEYSRTPDWPYRRAAIANYAGLTGVMTVIGLVLPVLVILAIARKFVRFREPRNASVMVGIVSLLLLNSYFFYSGVYDWGNPLPFPIHFNAIMFFAEFQFLKLVFASPLLAVIAALLGRWLFSSRPEKSRPSAQLA